MIDYTKYPRAMAIIVLFASVLSEANAEASLQAYYTGELLHNTGGGIDTGSAYLSDAGLTFEADVKALFGDSGAVLFAYLLWNNSNTFSDRYTGDLQGVSNIDAVNAVRVYELWYEQKLADAVSLRFGLYDLNAEFDVLDTASLFVNSSHGIGAEYGQSGRNGPSIFPVTSLSVRLEASIGESATLRYALLDGVPGDPRDASRTTIRLGGDDGVLHALEYNYRSPGGAQLALGGWRYTAEFDRIEGVDTNGEPLRGDGNGGAYASVDAPLYSSGDAGLEIAGFVRYGVANESFNPIRSYFGAGLMLGGFNRICPGDRLGLAVASAAVGDPFARQMAAGGANDRETSIELTYSTQIRDWLRLQPNLQYIVNPGANPALDDAWVVGLRFELSAKHGWPAP